MRPLERVATMLLVVVAVCVGVVLFAKIAKVGKFSTPVPTTPRVEVRGIVTLNDNPTIGDVEISNAISNVAADCKGQVMVTRGDYQVTVYCSPIK